MSGRRPAAPDWRLEYWVSDCAACGFVGIRRGVGRPPRRCSECNEPLTAQRLGGTRPVLQDWVMVLPWKQQSILISGMRGPDSSPPPEVKKLGRWMRSVAQHNADPTKDYMRGAGALPELDVKGLDAELHGQSSHYVHHLADALAVIAYGHPEFETAAYAARRHHWIAEELFHFQPEPAHAFVLRHRDKVDSDPLGADARWSCLWEEMRCEYLDGALARFRGKP